MYQSPPPILAMEEWHVTLAEMLASRISSEDLGTLAIAHSLSL